MIPNPDFDPYQLLLDTQQAMLDLARMQNDISNQIIRIYRILENLNARQDILNEQLKLVKNPQKKED